MARDVGFEKWTGLCFHLPIWSWTRNRRGKVDFFGFVAA